MTFFFMVHSREITIKGYPTQPFTFRVDQYVDFKAVIDEPEDGIYKQRLILTLKKTPESEEKEKVIEFPRYRIEKEGDEEKIVYVDIMYGSYVIDVVQKLQDVIMGVKTHITENDWQGFGINYDGYCKQRLKELNKLNGENSVKEAVEAMEKGDEMKSDGQEKIEFEKD